MPEAKVKDQGHSASVLQKKSFQKNFLGRSQKKSPRKISAMFVAFSIKMLTIQTIVLSSAADRAIFEDFRL